MPLFHVTVREHTYTGRFYHEVVEAESFEDALQLAAGRATAPQLPPGSEPEPDCANHRGVPMSGSTPCCAASWRRDTIRRTWAPHAATGARPGG